MNQAHIRAILEGVVPELKAAIATATKPLSDRIEALEMRAAKGDKGDPGPPGKSVTLDDVRPLIVESLAGWPKPENGKDADPAVIKAMVADAVAELPKPQDGKDADPAVMLLMVAEEVAKIPPATNGKDADPAVIEEMVTAALAKLPKPQDGKSVTLDEVRPLIDEAVAKIPSPQDGKSVTLEELRPLIDEAVAKIPAPQDGKDGSEGKPGRDGNDGKDGQDGKDGVGLAGAVIDRDGELVVTLTDGSHQKLGVVVGKDGDRGKDGLGFEDMDETIEDGGRVIVRRYSRGDETKEFRHVTWSVLYRGVWQAGKYQRGDMVSRGGSTWIAEANTETEPDTPNCDWRLSAKRGRDGKDLRDETRREPPIVKFR